MKFISYLGSKEKLYPFLSEIIFKILDKEDKECTFIDAFSGTTFMSNKMYTDTVWKISLCDLADYVPILASIINPNIDKTKILKLFKEMETIKPKKGIISKELSGNGIPETIEDFAKTFDNQPMQSRMFFRKEVGEKIDAIKYFIFEKYNTGKITEEEKSVLLLILLNYVDRNANTASVYGAYLKHFKDKVKPFCTKKVEDAIIEAKSDTKRKIEVKSGDIIQNLKELKVKNRDKTIIYLDPPYNTRKYESNYHILNYIIDENFSKEDIKFNSKTATPAKKIENKFGSKRETLSIFKEMIGEANRLSKHILISYNNEGVITEEQMQDICEEYNFTLKTHYKDYKRFTSGEANKKNVV